MTGDGLPVYGQDCRPLFEKFDHPGIGRKARATGAGGKSTVMGVCHLHIEDVDLRQSLHVVRPVFGLTGHFAAEISLVAG